MNNKNYENKSLKNIYIYFNKTASLLLQKKKYIYICGSTINKKHTRKKIKQTKLKQNKTHTKKHNNIKHKEEKATKQQK